VRLRVAAGPGSRRSGTERGARPVRPVAPGRPRGAVHRGELHRRGGPAPGGDGRARRRAGCRRDRAAAGPDANAADAAVRRPADHVGRRRRLAALLPGLRRPVAGVAVAPGGRGRGEPRHRAAAGAAALGRRLQRGDRHDSPLPPQHRHARRGPRDRPGRARHDLFPRDRRGDVPVSRFSVICLDMAGTTVRDDNTVMEAFAAAIGSRNLPVREFNDAMKYARATMGQSKIEVFRHILGDEDAARAANAAFEKHYACAVAGIKVCLSTGFAPVTRDAIVDALGWRSLVDLFLSPVDAGRGRPWPDMPLTALLRLGGDSVASLAVAGDTPADVESGLRAGAGLVVGVLSGDSARADLEAVPAATGLAGAPLILNSVADLLPHLA